MKQIISTEYGKQLGTLANGVMALDRIKILVDQAVSEAVKAGVDLGEAVFGVHEPFRHPSGTVLTPVYWHGWARREVAGDG